MGKQRYTYEYIDNFFDEKGCELLSTEYINCQTSLKYKCSCGNISATSFNNFQRGVRCIKCANDARRFTYEYISNFFKEQGCKLLSTEYINRQAPLKYQCR